MNSARERCTYSRYAHGSPATGRGSTTSHPFASSSARSRASDGWLSWASSNRRPVLAQDTGLAGLYPTGTGLVTFRTPDEAAAGVAAIEEDYPRHARTARALAEEFFDSDRVLTRLLDRLGVG